MMLDAYSFKPKSEEICEAPLDKKTINSEIRAIANGSNFASQQTMMAVKPLPPAVCLEIVCEMPDIRTATDEDLFGAIESAGTRKARELLVNFFNYTAAHEDVAYHVVELKKAEESSVAAYPYADFIRLAKVLFNEAYDTDHGLTAKAVETAIYAETWLFLACHYVCGWRASDICQRWVYPNLKDDANPFGINTETLKKDILSGSIPDSTYDSIALYVIRRIEMAFNVPGKTGQGKLRSAIMPALRPFCRVSPSVFR